MAINNSHNLDKANTNELSVNKFADMTQEEYKAYLILKAVSPSSERNYPTPGTWVPRAFSWIEHGAVTAVKD